MQIIKIYNLNRGMEFGKGKHAMVIMKSRKRQLISQIPKKIRTLGEKENYKYLGILGMDAMKHAVIQGNDKKRLPLTKEKTSRNQALQRNLTKDKQLGCPPCRLLRIILKIDREWTQTNGPEDKKVDDDTQSFTIGRWHRLYV